MDGYVMLTPEHAEQLWQLVEPGEAYRELNLEYAIEELGKWAVETAEMIIRSEI